MSRTTLDLDPGLIEELKQVAAEERQSMSRLANRLLRQALDRLRREQRRPGTFRWHVLEDGRPAEGFDPATRDYLDLLDEPRP